MTAHARTARRSPHLLRALGALAFASALTITPGPTPTQAQDAGLAPLRCAVENSIPQLPGKALCEQLGQALGRPMPWVADARKDKQGDALQIMRDDVQWTLVLLRKGAVRSWTRVSTEDARGRELAFFSRAVRSLLKTAPKGDAPCVRLDPKQRSQRAPDLVYPWAELKPCVRQVVDVVDPWWTTPAAK